MMKKDLPVIIIFLLFFSTVFSQSKTEIGLFGGGSLMMGDINADRYFKNPSYAAGIFYRYNYSQRYAFRVQLNYANLQASDSKSSDNYRLYRNASFNASIFDVATLFEFNFLPFKYSERYNTFSSYIDIGIGMHLAGVPFGVILPMGVGIKKTFGRRWCLGVEYAFRKTFNDKLDGVNNPVIPASSMNNNDWYAMTGFVISYKIFDEITDCPAYDNKSNKKH